MATVKKQLNQGEFAIIETGGKQYRVSKGNTIKIEKLSGGKKEGDTVLFDKVVLHDNGTETKVGSPYLYCMTVEGTLKSEARGKKVVVMKYKAKSRYKKVRGHRQPFMTIGISSIK